MADTKTPVTAEIRLCGYLSTKKCLYCWLNSHFVRMSGSHQRGELPAARSDRWTYYPAGPTTRRRAEREKWIYFSPWPPRGGPRLL